MKRIFLLSALIFVISCTGDGQTTYYWEQSGYGAEQFGIDQQDCMTEADWFRYNPEHSWIGGIDTLNLNPSFYDDKGMWSYYEPFKGAQPIYVNYSMGDRTIRKSTYVKCMKKRGYKQKYAPYIGNEVGTLPCNTMNCERNDYNNGIYKDYVPR